MIFAIYQILISLIILISPIIIIVRIIKNKEDKKRFLEKFSITNQKSFEKDIIWFHAASVGEVISIISIIKYFEKKKKLKKY
jgi:3-deoxy-D-manno-octulosonic-acid transferase